MSDFSFSFLLTSLAGLSTLLGSILIFFKTKNTDRIISSSLFFASGIMVSISLIDLIPESFTYLFPYFSYFLSYIYIILFIVIGIVLFLIITKVVPTFDEDGLYRVGLYSMIAIILHNVPEGIITFMVSSYDASLGFSLALAISMHNIPEGISISVPIYYSTKSRFKALLYTFISGISEPLGGVIAYMFFMDAINPMIMGILFSFIAGIMLFISLVELFPNAQKYDNTINSKVFFVIGFIFMIVVHFLN